MLWQRTELDSETHMNVDKSFVLVSVGILAPTFDFLKLIFKITYKKIHFFWCTVLSLDKCIESCYHNKESKTVASSLQKVHPGYPFVSYPFKSTSGNHDSFLHHDSFAISRRS